jgi:hypothetical protein
VQLICRAAKASVTRDGIHDFQRIFRPHFLLTKFLKPIRKY